jgi:hypothetical protein
MSKAAQKASREVFNVRAMAEGILRELPRR